MATAAAAGTPFQPPSAAHPFGTDDLGRDLLRAVLHGARVSLAVGLAVAGLSFVSGVTVGGVAGYLGGPLDELGHRPRVARAGVLSAREQEYVLAARALGASGPRILGRHRLPNVLAPVLAYAALQVGTAILLEARLSFLGFGDPNQISWGDLLNNAQALVRRAWWLSLFSGSAIVLAVVGVNLLADGLRGRRPANGWGAARQRSAATQRTS